MTEPMITYYRQDKEWLFASLDDIKKQMPSIRYKYNDYTSFANSEFSTVFPKDVIESTFQKQVDMFQSVYLINDGNRSYTKHEFPVEVQFSPVYGFETGDFNADGFIDILVVGNFYGSTTSIGRLDASYGNYLLGNATGNYEVLEPRLSGFSVFGETRAVKLIRSKLTDKIIVSRNNAAPRLFNVAELHQ
jgi:hypothetical protein